MLPWRVIVHGWGFFTPILTGRTCLLWKVNCVLFPVFVLPWGFLHTDTHRLLWSVVCFFCLFVLSWRPTSIHNVFNGSFKVVLDLSPWELESSYIHTIHPFVNKHISTNNTLLPHESARILTKSFFLFFFFFFFCIVKNYYKIGARFPVWKKNRKKKKKKEKKSYTKQIYM